MRGRFLWWCLAFCFSVTFARAQIAQPITGRVVQIGFGNTIQMGEMTPMRVAIRANVEPGQYELRVLQHDLDGDEVVYTRPISLGGENAGEQQFWTYFQPEAIKDGLPTNSPSGLASRLRVSIYDSDGRDVATLAITQSMQSAELERSYGTPRSGKLILLVGGTSAAIREYDANRIAGVTEDLVLVQLSPQELPTSAIGYTGVDAICWLSGDPAEINTGSDNALSAIREYVRSGGHFIVTAQPQWQLNNALGDLLAVQMEGVVDKYTTAPISDLAGATQWEPAINNPDLLAKPPRNPWDFATGPFQIIKSKPVPGAYVERWYDLNDNDRDEKDMFPWLVHKPLGMGCVSFCASDLTDSRMTRAYTPGTSFSTFGWPRVWNAVLGFRDTPLLADQMKPEDFRKSANSSGMADVGLSFEGPSRLGGRTFALVAVTLLFFGGYWLLAGPGIYLGLLAKRRTGASWFGFGAVAIGAACVAVLLTRLLLGGAAELKYSVVVRSMGGLNPMGRVMGQANLYIPRNGPQDIALPAGAAERPSLLTPLATHPRRARDSSLYAAPRRYTIAVPNTGSAAELRLPYRSTSKRIELDWTGAPPAQIGGTAKLQTPGVIGGVITNTTGTPLTNCYFVFRNSFGGSVWRDEVLFVRTWNVNGQLDLNATYNTRQDDPKLRPLNVSAKGGIDALIATGEFSQDWATDVFFPQASAGFDDFGSNRPASIPMLSLFNRLPPTPPAAQSTMILESRAELARSGIRELDASNALLAGNLVIIAQADNVALPIALTVNGDETRGTGRIIYQFIVPLDRPADSSRPQVD